MTVKTSELHVKTFEVPDDGFSVGDFARVEVLHLGDVDAHRATFQPGLHWTEHVKPLVGTELCEIPHTGYVLSGRIGLRMADGAERELGPGDVFNIGPGHDIWVIGDEPYVAIDFSRTDAPLPLK